MCAYELCPSPLHSKKWRVVTAGTNAGGQDWNAFVGQTLCHSCYSAFLTHGSFVRSIPTNEGSSSVSEAFHLLLPAAVTPHHGRGSESGDFAQTVTDTNGSVYLDEHLEEEQAEQEERERFYQKKTQKDVAILEEEIKVNSVEVEAEKANADEIAVLFGGELEMERRAFYEKAKVEEEAGAASKDAAKCAIIAENAGEMQVDSGYERDLAAAFPALEPHVEEQKLWNGSGAVCPP